MPAAVAMLALAITGCKKSGSDPAPPPPPEPAPIFAANGMIPSSGPVGGSTAVTISGSGFETGAVVQFGANSATNVTVVDPSTITATSPPGASSGVVAVTVVNPGGGTAAVPGGFLYLGTPPSATSLSPTSGPASGGTTISISGSAFATGAGVTVGGSAAAGVTVVNSGLITAVTPAGSGVVTVTVINPDGQSASLTNAFTYVTALTVTGVTPSGGPTAGGTVVTVSGTGFVSGAGVTVGGSALTGVTFLSSTALRGTTPTHAAGAVTVTVTNPGGASASLPAGYTYAAPPTVISISPSTGPANGTIAVTISGSNFASGATADFSGTPLTGVSVVSASTITATTPALAAGVYHLTVTNPGGVTDTLNNAFSYVGGPGAQTAQYTWDTGTGIDATKRWYLDMHWSAFATDLRNRGMQTGTAADPVNAYALDWVRGYVLQYVNIMYGRNGDGTAVSGTSINVTFRGTPPATGSPGSTSSTGYSRLCFGGAHAQSAGILGTARFDGGSPCGNSAEDDCIGPQFGIGTSATLGVWTASIPTTSLSPALSQTDQQYLDGTTMTGTRYNDVHARLQRYGLRIAYITAHEMGHSLGLVGSTLSGSCTAAGQCGATGGHNNCCFGTNIMAASASFSGLSSPTSKAFSGQPGSVSASGSCYTGSLSSWAMLQSYLGVAP